MGRPACNSYGCSEEGCVVEVTEGRAVGPGYGDKETHCGCTIQHMPEPPSSFPSSLPASDSIAELRPGVAPKLPHWLGRPHHCMFGRLQHGMGTLGFSTISCKQGAAGPWSKDRRPRCSGECCPEAATLAGRAPHCKSVCSATGWNLGLQYHQPQTESRRTLERRAQAAKPCRMSP